MNDHSEEWRPVVGFERVYEVSDQGQVRRSERPDRMLRQSTGKGGYQLVQLTHGAAKRKTGQVHRLVLEAFLGPKPEGLICCHTNGNPADNRLANLRYDTYSANGLDSVLHGTCFQSSKDRCPAGHLYDEKNTRFVKTTFGSGIGRQCRTCDRRRQQEKRAANREAYNAAARERRRKRKESA
jgi:HNH endonuclease/NUMOD4 motif